MVSTVAVFGSTGAIGLELVRLFLRRNWWVLALGRSFSSERFLHAVDADGQAPSVERLCYRRIPDIGRATINDVIESCGAPWQKPQVYVNAVGLCFYGSFSSASRRDFERMVESNLSVSFCILGHVCNFARRHPKMPLLYVEIGSRAGANVDHPNFSLYAMVKQGQVGLLRSLAAEMEGTLCDFLVVSPRGVKTRLYERSLGDRQALLQKFMFSSDLLSTAHVAEAVLVDVEHWLGGDSQEPTSFKCRVI